MSNVFSNTSFAVLSVMHAHDKNNNSEYLGSTVFVQRKPESDYGNITVLSYGTNNETLEKADFDNQPRFEANVVPRIQKNLTAPQHTGNVHLSNSSISPVSYTANGTVVE
tara:strand:- start:14 stop:343 length:330 start_codon:yes stop_codon:yes gene_type:complete